MTKTQEIDLINYMENKVAEIVNAQRMWKRWAITSIIMIALALITTGYMNIKAVSGLETKTEILWKEYVPGDLFLAIVHSFDLQNRYTMSLLNGNKEEAEKAYREFINFRDNIYEQHFKIRGSVLPMEGRIITKL